MLKTTRKTPPKSIAGRNLIRGIRTTLVFSGLHLKCLTKSVFQQEWSIGSSYTSSGALRALASGSIRRWKLVKSSCIVDKTDEASSVAWEEAWVVLGAILFDEFDNDALDWGLGVVGCSIRGERLGDRPLERARMLRISWVIWLLDLVRGSSSPSLSKLTEFCGAGELSLAKRRLCVGGASISSSASRS